MRLARISSILFLVNLCLLSTPFEWPSLIVNIDINEMCVIDGLCHSKHVSDITQSSQTLLFTGDLMLARHVERLANNNGRQYSFASLASFAHPSDILVSNFEASLPVVHVPTPDFTMRFSVSRQLASVLPDYNINYVSLANNHAADYGLDSYRHTRTQLAAMGVTAFGHPTKLNSDSIAYIELDAVTVAVVGIHALYSQPSAEELLDTFARATALSDWQIAYVHWGNEYEGVHSQSQHAFATQLVAAGADAVIGHHPHVVQDIDIIDRVPVFYSLGNFVFDQYFSDAVMDGLLVRLRFSTTEIQYELVPITTKFSHAQPARMDDSRRSAFMADLLAKSGLSTADAYRVGLLSDKALATSTQISIMTQ